MGWLAVAAIVSSTMSRLSWQTQAGMNIGDKFSCGFSE